MASTEPQTELSDTEVETRSSALAYSLADRRQSAEDAAPEEPVESDDDRTPSANDPQEPAEPEELVGKEKTGEVEKVQTESVKESLPLSDHEKAKMKQKRYDEMLAKKELFDMYVFCEIGIPR